MVEAVDTAGPTPRRVGGWLVLVGIQLLATPLVAIYEMRGLPSLLIGSPSLGASELGSVIVGFLREAALLVVAPVYLLALFLRRSRTFPSLFIWWILLVGLTQVAVDIVAGLTVGADGALPAAVYPLLLWVPYFARAPRIKETFVN